MSHSRSGRPREWRWGLRGGGPDRICPEAPVVEQGVWEQLGPDRREVLCGHPAHDGRGDWMVRPEDLSRLPVSKSKCTNMTECTCVMNAPLNTYRCAGYLFQRVGKIAATAVGGGFLLLQARVPLCLCILCNCTFTTSTLTLSDLKCILCKSHFSPTSLTNWRCQLYDVTLSWSPLCSRKTSIVCQLALDGRRPSGCLLGVAMRSVYYFVETASWHDS